MKLRVRSTATKETLRVEAPDAYSLHDLKSLIAAKLSPSVPPDSIRLSLNRTDELLSPSPGDSLSSLGLTSGDLLFLSLAPGPQTLTPDPAPIPPTESPDSDAPSQKDAILKTAATLDSNRPREIVAENPNFTVSSVQHAVSGPSLTLDSNRPQEMAAEYAEDHMEVEEESPVAKKSVSVPGFLKRVMEEEKGEVKCILGRLVIVVHAVFLESGFLVYDGHGFRLPEGWASSATSAVSVQYTLPGLVGLGNDEKDVKIAILKFAVMGNYVTVYGYVSGDRPDVYRVCFDGSKLEPLLNLDMDSMDPKEEKEIFQHWKAVKDGLSLHLLIDICQKNGLPLPACFMLLPVDLKIKVLGLIPGVDIAKVASTCSELRYLSSDDELWKHKFVEEFGLLDERQVAGRSWKEKYAFHWVKKKDANKWIERENTFVWPQNYFRRFHPVVPQRFPMLGGDYDRFPAIGGFGPRVPRIGFPGLPSRRNFSPPCNLGGFNAEFEG
ncbi:F-box protein SKIP22 [Elaeis guineensis]|uniref:F-box protein SKIP22 n=1 Tax=Elaeis guineensis var. tenera TaxID=51953 RepID=A0A6I9QG49_ELAGV|nr:F-box protein SKIP22 [Elaeis guineensis]